MKIKLLFLCFLIISFFSMSACTRVVQLNEKMIIQAIGIDVEEEGYKIIVQSLDFKNASDGEPGISLTEIKGKSLAEGLENTKKETGLIPMYSQNLVVVVGKDLAILGVNSFIDFFIRHYETRPNAKICVSETTASDILLCKNVKAKQISSIIPVSLKSDILHFAGRIRGETSDPYCAYLSLESEKIKLKGLAIFSNDKMVSSAEENDYLALLTIFGAEKAGTYKIYLEEIGDISLKIDKSKSDILLDSENKSFHIDIKLETSVVEVDSKNFQKIGEDEQIRIEKQLDSEIKKICKQAVENTVNLNSDIFRLQKIILKKDINLFNQINKNPKENLKDFEFNICVKSHISVTGVEI